MINFRKDYGIKCDKCYEPLDYKMDDKIMIAHRGQSIYEDTPKNIKDVAKMNGWKITENIHLRETCRSKKK